MPIYTTIENRQKGLYVFNDGPLGSSVRLTHVPTDVELTPGLTPVDNVARIKGVENALYINIGPVGEEHLIWSLEPREWKHNIDDDTISTIHHGQALYWFLRDQDNTIILNPHEGSRFLYTKH